jgi:hypothetical protein
MSPQWLGAAAFHLAAAHAIQFHYCNKHKTGFKPNRMEQWHLLQFLVTVTATLYSDLSAGKPEPSPKKKKKTPWPLVRKRTILTERPPLVEEI